jgi:hypothetical protein
MPDVPYDLTPDFLETLFTKHRIDYVVHGDDPCLLPDGTDAYATVKKQGRFRMVRAPFCAEPLFDHFPQSSVTAKLQPDITAQLNVMCVCNDRVDETHRMRGRSSRPALRCLCTSLMIFIYLFC